MIQEFSSGYYHMTMNVQEYDDGPVIERGLYDFINKKLYLDEDSPVMMRVGLDAGPTFTVDVEGAIPRDVLALPRELRSRIGVDDGPTSVFLLKGGYANSVGEYYG